MYVGGVLGTLDVKRYHVCDALLYITSTFNIKVYIWLFFSYTSVSEFRLLFPCDVEFWRVEYNVRIRNHVRDGRATLNTELNIHIPMPLTAIHHKYHPSDILPRITENKHYPFNSYLSEGQKYQYNQQSPRPSPISPTEPPTLTSL